MLSVRCVTGLDAVPECYASLFEGAGRRNIFLSLPWFRNFEQSILTRQEGTLVLGVEDSKDCFHPVGALVLWDRRQGQGLLRPVTLEGLSNYYSCYYGLVTPEDASSVDQVTSAIARELTSGRQTWDVLNLRPLDPEAPAFQSLVRALQRAGAAVQTYFCFGNWYLKVDGRSYDEYAASLPTVLKETIRRKGKKFAQSGGRLEIVTGGPTLEAAISAYQQVYNSSWKVPEPFPLFMPGLIRICADQGWLRLGVAYINEEPVAAQLWIVNGGAALIFKLAYVEQFAKLSAGTLLTAALMQHVFDVDKVSEVDYLSGDDEYKKSWMSHRRERWGIIAFNTRSFRGWLQIVRHIGGRAVKNIWSTMIQPSSIEQPHIGVAKSSSE